MRPVRQDVLAHESRNAICADCKGMDQCFRYGDELYRCGGCLASDFVFTRAERGEAMTLVKSQRIAFEDMRENYAQQMEELGEKLRLMSNECIEAVQLRDKLLAENEALREALTASAETKADYLGEFKFEVDCRDTDGEEYQQEVTVPWTTVKEIMAAIGARALLAKPSGEAKCVCRGTRRMSGAMDDGDCPFCTARNGEGG